MIAAVLAFLLGTAPVPGGEVRGRIVDGDTGDPVPGAYVGIAGASAVREARTGADGAYTFSDLPAGTYRLQIGHPGYESATVRIMLRDESRVVIDVPLALRPIEFTPIHVAATRDRAIGEMPGAADSAALALRARRPGGFGPQGTSALADMVAGGVARDVPEPDGSRNAHVLYIWGSNGERGRVLIDGAALNGPLHLGGMLPPVDPELLSAAELRSGGVSPRHDGGTTYVMDFATRPARPDGVHVSGEADLLTGRLAVETPLGERGGVIVGARRVNHELVDRLLGRPFGYGYGDVLARGDYAFGERGRLQATFFTTHESIDIPRDLGQDEASWRNIAAAVAWHATGPGAFRTARASYGRGTADLPLLSAPEGHLRATVERFAAAAERTWMIGGTTGIVGAEVEHLRYDRISGAASDPTVPISLAVQCTQSLPCAKASSTGFAAFGETTWRVGGNWSARAGVRVAYEDAKPSVQLLPRIALTGLIGEQGLVTISAGRFSQPYAWTPAANRETGGDTPLALDNTTVVHAHATHVEINAVRRSGRASLSATAFLRRHDAQPAGADARATPGVDLSWTYDAGDFSTSLGYSFARSPVIILAGDSVRNRHLVAAGVAASRGPFVLQASAAYGAGLPLASLVLEHPDQLDDRIQAEAPAVTGGNVPERTRPPRNFLRLDASLGAELRFRSGLLTPYVKIMNALSDREALFYYHEAQIGGDPRPLATLPAIPVFGIRWSF